MREAVEEPEDQGYDQGTFGWERVRAIKRLTRSSREIIDVGAFKRLVARNFDGRPRDVRESDDG